MTTTDTAHLRALLKIAKTAEEVSDLLREFFKDKNNGAPKPSDIPMFYEYEMDSALELDLFLCRKMELVHIFIPGKLRDLSDLSLYVVE
jgi:hypothetical protein